MPDKPRDAARHPAGLYVLFFTEMWERFGFYTMSAIFTLYLRAPRAQGGMGMPKDRALGYYGYFTSSAYFTPLLGGLAADFILGERRSITIGAVLLAIGYFLLALPPGDGMGGLYLAIATIAAGNGLFKPNISTIVGKLYPANSPLQDSGFNIFYTGINLGALFAPLAASYLRNHFSWQAAFGSAGVGMIISLIIFTIFAKHFTGDALIKQVDTSGTEAVDAGGSLGVGPRLLALAILYVVSTMFWTMFFQNGGALTLWAADCTSMPAWISPEMFQAVNPACIVLFSLVAARVWQNLAQKGAEPSVPNKILVGLVVAILACGLMMLASFAGGNACGTAGAPRVTMLWLVGTYILVSIAEILVSPMGLSYCTKVAPGRGGGLVMGGWFVSLSAGGLLSGKLGEGYWESLAHSSYFGLLAGGTAAVAVLLFAVRNVLNRAVPS